MPGNAVDPASFVFGSKSFESGNGLSRHTIAFGETLVGDNSVGLQKWRDGPVLATQSATATAGGPSGLYDANQNIAGVTTDLQACAAGFMVQNPPEGGWNSKGFRWSQDDGGFATFNTIVTSQLQHLSVCMVCIR